MNKNCPEILKLKNRVETQVKRKIKTPNDFIFLSGVIWERTHETISPTTLKRLWGYIDGADHTRNSTLRILSTFLGFRDWDEFLQHLSDATNVQSEFLCTPHISATDLQLGERVEVSWKPNRHCVFRYLGNEKFVVDKSENSKLAEGDTFSCSFFFLNEPLYITNLVQGKNPPVDFVAGNKDGLTQIEHLPSK